MISAVSLAAALLLACAIVPPASGATPVHLPRASSADCVGTGVIEGRSSLFPSQFQIVGTGSSSAASVQVTVAQFFDVHYYDTFKVVRNTKKNETYVLFQCGTEQPSPDADKFPADAKFFEIPLAKVSVPDTTSAAFMEALDVLDRVAYVTTYTASPCLLAMSGSGCSLVSYGATSPNISSDSSVSAVFHYTADAKQRKSIAFTASGDPGALNRAEWVKFMSTFFNKEHEANALFSSVSQTYKAISSAAKQAAATQPKVVAWIQWWGDKKSYGPFDTPAISFNFPAYKVQLAQDAGASVVDLGVLQQYLDSGVASQPWLQSQPAQVFIRLNETATLRAILRDVDLVIDEARYLDVSNAGTPDVDIKLANFLTQYGLDASDVQRLKFLKNDGLLREDGVTNPSSYNEWFGMAIVRPDQVLSDLVQTLHPTAVQQLGQLGSTVQLSSPMLLRNVAKSQAPVLMTPQQCPLQGCRLPASAICPYVYQDCDGKVVEATPSQRCAPACPAVSTKPLGLGAEAARPAVLAAIVTALFSLVLVLLL